MDTRGRKVRASEWLNTVLDLRFSTLAGRASISCDEASTRHLQTLRGRYASSVSISNQAFEVEIDDLLVNLQDLAAWPVSDDDIRWQPELLRVVEGNAADTAVLERRLTDESNSPSPPPIDFGSRWVGELTGFQLRDLDKLRRLGHGANFSVPGW